MFTKTNKVKFQDQQLEDYELENAVLKSKLQSKMDALSIMSAALDKCSMERDRFKELVEQLKQKNILALPKHDSSLNMYRFTPSNTISGGEMLTKTREQNNMLKLEVETLRSKLEEATGDIVALRKQMQKSDSFENYDSRKSSSELCSNKEYEKLIQDLEKTQKKYQQIQLDYKATLDEKEELMSDRDYYKNKVHRLNHQISYILSNRIKPSQDCDVDPPRPILDLDAMVTENKYLHERITQLQVEKEIIKRTLTKYKTLLDNRNKNQTLNRKQVRDFLNINSKTEIKRTSATEMKSLCQGLFEALNDKSIALQHQRKTNQILANRITELEKTLDSWCNGQKYIPVFPSQMLLDEFLPDCNSEKSVEKNYKEPSHDENKIYEYSESEYEIRNNSDDSSNKSNDESVFSNGGLTTKTVLPFELEQLVKEALAELKTM